MANTTTIGDIANTVAHKILNRSDAANDWALTSAVQAYRSICSKVPFDELKVESDSISCTSGTARYDLATLLDYDVAGIIAIRYTPASGSSYRLIRREYRQYLARASTTSGPARTYARSTSTNIDLSPTPSNSSDSFKVYYWKQPTIATKPAETQLEIPEEWEVLLQFETLYLTYHFLQEPQKAMTLIQPNPVPMPYSSKKRISTEVGIIPRLWNDLLETRSNREHVDEDFSINPQRRPYSR